MSEEEDYLYGLHSVGAALEAGTELTEIRVAKNFRGNRLGALVAEAWARGIRVRRVPRADLDRRAKGGRHQGILARVAATPLWSERDLHARLDDLVADPLLLLLDGVTDPRNLGACLRVADAAGAHAVVIPRDRRAPLSATARKAASGAAETLPLVSVANLGRAMEALGKRGIFLLGASGAGETLWYRSDGTGPIGWVLGAEGEGLRPLTARRCDTLVQIPMAGSVASLNVSVAAGVLLFESVRQRRTEGKEAPL